MTEELAKYEATPTPAAMMMTAIEKGLDLDKVEKAMLLQERWEANEARKAYHLAMADFKSNLPTVFKDKQNKQYGSKYASENAILNTINPELSKHGLSSSFTFDQTETIKVTCTITHEKGHKESVSLSGAPDGSGSKNPLQQIKSTITYLRKATFEAITGIASSDEESDDDGNDAGSGNVEYIDEKQATEIREKLTQLDRPEEKMCAHFKIESVEKIPAKRFNEIVSVLKESIKAMKKKADPVSKAEADLKKIKDKKEEDAKKALIDEKNKELGVDKEPGDDDK